MADEHDISDGDWVDLSEETKVELRKVTDDFFDRPIEKANEFDWDEFEQNEPFKAIMMPSEQLWRFANFERSFTQKLGERMYEQFARAVADGNADFGAARTGHTIEEAIISPEQQTEIEAILRDLDRGAEPNWPAERRRVIDAGGAPSIDVSGITWDLYVKDYRDGRPLFAEIKTPKPNVDQALAAKRQMLLTIAAHAHTDGPIPEVYFAFPFNPYGSVDEYAHWPTKSVFDIEGDSILVAEEFWNAIGGPGTMQGLCRFLREESKDNLERLAELSDES